MSEEFQSPHRTWWRKFADSFRGIAVGVRGQTSFLVHVLTAAAVIALAAILRMDRTSWCLLLLCIGAVLTAEMFNSSLERLAKAVDRSHNVNLRDALDIASGAVLIASLAAAAVGLIVFIPPLLRLLLE